VKDANKYARFCGEMFKRPASTVGGSNAAVLDGAVFALEGSSSESEGANSVLEGVNAEVREGATSALEGGRQGYVALPSIGVRERLLWDGDKSAPVLRKEIRTNVQC
jgi:hypothetical protein